MSRELLTQDVIDQRLAGLHADWSGSTEALRRSIEFADFPTAVEFISRLAPICEEIDHHPDLDLRWRTIHVSLVTHSSGGVTDMDFLLAGHVDEVAGALPLAK
jgi:4a-hydroxytetrahydrobiopterin dehydratase